MRTSRRPTPCPTLVSLILWAVAVLPAAGQDRLDPSLYNNSDLWSPSQRQQVAAFIDQQIAQIQSSDEQAIDQGKARLNAELTLQNANERFIAQLSELTAERLAPLVKDEDVKVRINAMIVLGNARTARALDLVLAGLADDNAGVRYLASKAMEALLRSGRLPDAERTRALDQLSQILVDEGEIFVVGPMLEALVQARDNLRVLSVLNQRVAWHAARPAVVYGPESSTFREIFTSLFVGANRPPSELRELARASARYVLLIAQQEVAKSGRIQADASRLELLNIAVRALEVAHTDLRVSDPLPPVSSAVETRDWPRLVTAGQTWIDLLQSAPFNFDEQAVSVSAN